MHFGQCGFDFLLGSLEWSFCSMSISFTSQSFFFGGFSVSFTSNSIGFSSTSFLFTSLCIFFSSAGFSFTGFGGRFSGLGSTKSLSGLSSASIGFLKGSLASVELGLSPFDFVLASLRGIDKMMPVSLVPGQQQMGQRNQFGMGSLINSTYATQLGTHLKIGRAHV